MWYAIASIDSMCASQMDWLRVVYAALTATATGRTDEGGAADGPDLLADIASLGFHFDGAATDAVGAATDAVDAAGAPGPSLAPAGCR